MKEGEQSRMFSSLRSVCTIPAVSCRKPSCNETRQPERDCQRTARKNVQRSTDSTSGHCQGRTGLHLPRPAAVARYTSPLGEGGRRSCCASEGHTATCLGQRAGGREKKRERERVLHAGSVYDCLQPQIKTPSHRMHFTSTLLTLTHPRTRRPCRSGRGSRTMSTASPETTPLLLRWMRHHQNW